MRATLSISTSKWSSRWIAPSTPSTYREINPTGCLHDLQSAVTTTYATPPGGTPRDTGQTMEFFNMQKGDAPLFKSLADNYTMSDNYHQPVLGGTGPDSQPLGFADQVFYSDGSGHPATPPANNIYDPDPVAGTLSLYTHRAQWFNCSDPTQPGIAPITNYLNSLPYTVQTKCDPGAYWQAVNVNPAFTPKRLVQTGLVVPQTMGQSIGDVLTAHNIPWKYYGGGFNADGTGDPFDGSSIHKCRVEDQLAWASAICIGSKFRSMRSTPTESVSTRLKLLVCLAKTGVNTPLTILPSTD